MTLLGFNFDLKDQLTFYGSYHNNPINQAIHFVFVPAILWTTAVWLAYTPPFLSRDILPLLPACCTEYARYLVFNGSFVLLASYAAYYLLLEPLAGLSWTACMALPMWAGANAVQQHVANAWTWALGLHLLSWFAQVHFGHTMAEKRKPALLDSFFQSLVLAPLFVWFELLFLLGYRRQLASEVQARVQANILAWKQQGQVATAKAPLLGKGANEGGGSKATSPAL